MHIVIFTGGNHPDKSIVEKFFARYKSKPDCVIAADSGLQALSQTQLKPNFIVGDFDSLENKSLVKKYPDAEVCVYPCDKDFTDTELALQIATKLSASDNINITIIGAGGTNRLDHLLYFLHVFENKTPPAVWLFDTGVGFCISRKQQKNLTTTLPIGTTVSVFALRQCCKLFTPKINSRGLHWSLDKLNWRRFASISNRNDSEKISLKVKRGRFLIIINGYDWLTTFDTSSIL